MRKRPNYNLIWGCIITGFTLCVIIVSLFWTPYDPNAMDAAAKAAPPSWAHLLGTDNFGRDVLSRVMQGMGTTVMIAVCAVIIGGSIGTLVGAVTGYFGGVADEVIMRINDAVTAFPSILLALIVVCLIGGGISNLIGILGVLFIPSFARMVRGEFAKQRGLDYVKNAKLMGVKNLRIMFVHILPNVWPVLLSAIAIGFNNAVLAEASMSFVGVGVSPTESASLGRMLMDAQTYLLSTPWYALSAGGAICIIILGFALISEGLGYTPVYKKMAKRRQRANA